MLFLLANSIFVACFLVAENVLRHVLVLPVVCATRFCFTLSLFVFFFYDSYYEQLHSVLPLSSRLDNHRCTFSSSCCNLEALANLITLAVRIAFSIPFFSS